MDAVDVTASTISYSLTATATNKNLQEENNQCYISSHSKSSSTFILSLVTALYLVTSYSTSYHTYVTAFYVAES